jgi:hypothetical protein
MRRRGCGLKLMRLMREVHFDRYVMKLTFFIMKVANEH